MPVTVPIINGSNAAQNLSLPLIGIAGTPSTDVGSIQGISGMTPVTVNTSSNSPLNTTPANTSNTPLYVSQTGSVTLTANTSVSIAGTPSVAISGTPTVFPSNTANAPLYTSQTGSITLAANTSVSISGSPTVTLSGTPSVVPTNTSNTPLYITPTTSIITGATPGKIDGQGTTSTVIKNTAGKLNHISIYNTASSLRWVKLYDSATSVTVGSGTPVQKFPVPATGGYDIYPDKPLNFANGIVVLATTGPLDTDTGAPGTTDIYINHSYL